MPLLIRELHIKITMEDQPPQQGRGSLTAPTTTGFASGAKDEIITECVEQVLEILRTKIEK